MTVLAMEMEASRAIARGRLLEQAIHDPGPWNAMVHGCCTHYVPAERHMLPEENRVVFTCYLSGTCTGISEVDLYSGGFIVASRGIPELPSAPCRITWSVGVYAAELTR